MLVAFLFAAAAIQESPAQQLPDMRHMAQDGMVDARRSAHVIEWYCRGSDKASVAEIEIEDLGVPSWNHSFDIRLARLIVQGAEAEPGVRAKVEQALADLNRLGTLAGQCSGRGPGLFIEGYVRDGRRSAKETFRVHLK